MRKVLLILLLVFLCSCDSAVDVRDQLPKVFPIKERVYNKSIISKACAVNVYTLESNFKTTFKFEILEAINDRKINNQKHQLDQSYEPWQKTPVATNIYETSKSAGTLSTAYHCFQDNEKYWDVFKKYSSGAGGYFASYSGEILIYAPEENLLIFADWD